MIAINHRLLLVQLNLMKDRYCSPKGIESLNKDNMLLGRLLIDQRLRKEIDK